ncbi:hypothetical protein C8Q75DRAFT_804472 [Abortiporus biennis]|nr:hypothetical protein C8Q75DRAFT_804472 [Abortiporus biennis]
MLHCFVAARLVPGVPALTIYGQQVASKLPTKPFLALQIKHPYDPVHLQAKPNLFVITRERPDSPSAEFFILNHPDAGIRSLVVEPPLPFQGPLYLLVTPRIVGTFLRAPEDMSKSFPTSDPKQYQFEESSLSRFLKSLETAQPSIPGERDTGGDDEASPSWDTWSVDDASK